MRILISNPDTIGDFVLREPLVTALVEAGHELMLVVRASVEPLARQVAPAAHVLFLRAEPYALATDGPWEPFAELFDEAIAFAPDVFVVAPYRWTLLEERLATELSATPRVGLSGNLYRGDPFAGAAPVSTMTFDQVATVNEADAETLKNAALAAMLLGRPLERVEPRLTAPQEGLDRAAALLAETGLQHAAYWAACVGGTTNVAIKTWPAERWGAALAHWAHAHGRRFGFIGVPDEAPAVHEVIGAMGDAAHNGAAVDLIRPDHSLATLQGLIALSAGYVGHDTGPMHLAAALGKPVVAVFGQGTWPRFLPAVAPSVAVCVDVPCAGCGWVCAFEHAYCIKSVPVDAVTSAIDDMEAGRVIGRDVRPQTVSAALLARLTRESARSAEARLREAAEGRKRLAFVDAELAAARAAADARPVGQVVPEAPDGETAVTEPAEPAADAVLVARPADAVDEEATAPTSPSAEPPPVTVAVAEPVTASPAVETVGAEAPAGQPPTVPQVELAVVDRAAVAAASTEALRAVVAELQAKVDLLEQERDHRAPLVPPKRARRPWRQVLVEAVIGRQHVPPVGWKRYLPVSVIVPVTRHDDVASVKASVGSVLRQDYPNREVLVVDDGRNEAVTAYVASLGRAVRGATLKDADAYALVRAGFEQSWGEVLAFLRPGVVHASGVVTRAAKLFGERTFVKAAYFQAARDDGGAWRWPLGPHRRIDTLDFLTGEPVAYESLFWRRSAYLLVGQMHADRGPAADWDLAARTARMFGLHAVDALGPIVPSDVDARADTPERAESLAAAREAFLQNFGSLGRARCDAIHAINGFNAWLDHHFVRRRFSFGGPTRPVPAIAFTDAGEPHVAGHGVDRLLFSDVGPQGVREAYLSNGAGVVTVVDRAGVGGGGASVYTGCPLRRARLTRAEPPVGATPVAEPPSGSDAADFAREIGLVTPATSVLNLTGSPPVYEDVFAAPLLVPDGQTFDVVLLGRSMQTAPDAVAMLCRAKTLLNPGGAIVLSGDNLDSFLLDVYGPTWAGWARGRTLVSLTSLNVVARSAGLRVAWSKTHTPLESAVRSVTRHRTGVLAIDSDGVSKDDWKAAHRLAGWGRLLYDWRGRGEEICAVLKE